MYQQVSKRQLLAGGGAVAFAAFAYGAANAQERAVLQIGLSPEEIGRIHAEQVSLAGKTIFERDAFSRQSLYSAIDRLVQLELMNGAEAELLKALVDAVLSGEALEQILGNVAGIYEGAIEDLGELAAAIAAIVRDSVAAAQQVLASEEIQVVIEAIIHDFRGALDGAATGGSVGSVVPGLGKLAGAVIGALIGAVSDSTIGFFDRDP